jgi:hypothetical protein
VTALLAVVGGISGLVFSLMYKRYVGVLGAGGGRKGSPAREAYDHLRESLSAGNLAARLYGDRLRRFLDAINRFFGDFGKADATLFPHAFGLRTPAPLWTAPAFDRCLLLALIYPIATIFIIWTISGHVGPAEAALGLKADFNPCCPPPRPLAGCRRRRSSIDGDPSFSIHLFLCSTGFHRLPRYYEEIRLQPGHRLVVVAFFPPTA